MKKFASHRPYKDIKTACKKEGFAIRTKKYKQGSDYIGFDFKHESTVVDVLYSTFNGSAFGFKSKGTPQEEWFSTDSEEHEDEPWFIALLDFIYVPVEEPASC